MQLDYIENLNEYGDSMVRLYDFDKAEATLFVAALNETMIQKQETLDVSQLDFVLARNCNLILRIADEDLGITRKSKKKFFCDLTLEGYREMIQLLQPFCEKDTMSYQFLYDIDSQIDFLYSSAGSW